MKICRFIVPSNNQAYYGALLDNQTIMVVEESSVYKNTSPVFTEQTFALEEVELILPVMPSKIVCVGRNYKAHADELGNEVPAEPLLFLKAPSSLVKSGDPIVLPAQSAKVEHEGELAVIIKDQIKNLPSDQNPFDHFLGYLCLNDVTARDLQKRDGQFTRAKSFDSFCPIGNFIETEADVTDLEISVRLNGIVKQHGRTSQMIFSVENLIRYISNQMTLLPGDIIATGTPAGVSQLNEQDVVTVEIENVGILENPVTKGL